MINLQANLYANQQNDILDDIKILVRGESMGRSLTMNLYNADGSPLDLSNASMVSLFFVKGDGTNGQIICDIVDETSGTINMTFTSNSTAAAGDYHDCIIKITWSDGSNSKIIGPKITVRNSASDDAPISSNEYQILDQLITDQTDATATAVQAAEDATAAAQTATDAKTAAQTAATTAQTAATTATEAQTAAETAKTAAQAASTDAAASAASAGTDATRAETAATQAVAASTNVDQIVADAAEAVRDDIQIGGRNLLANSDIVETRTKDATDTKSYTLYVVDGYDLDTLINKELTASVYMYSPGERDWSLVESVGTRNRFGVQASIGWENDSGETTSTYLATELLSQAVTEGKRIHHTFKVEPPDGYTHIQFCAVAIQIYARPASTNDATWVLSRPQLEIGNMATDWTPAPEDPAPDALKLGGVDASSYVQKSDLTTTYCTSIDDATLSDGWYYTDGDTTGTFPSGYSKVGVLCVRQSGSAGYTQHYMSREGEESSRGYSYDSWAKWTNEVGTWTPVLKTNTSATVDATYTVQEGYFSKSGQLVHVSFRMGFKFNASLYENAVYIGNMPYKARADEWGGICAISGVDSTLGITQFMLRSSTGGTSFMLARKEVAAIKYEEFNNQTNTDLVRYLYGSISYIIAAGK